MSKLPNYTGTIKLISGLTQANGQDFPILEAHSIVVDEDGTRLDSLVSQIPNMMTKFGRVDEGEFKTYVTFDKSIYFQTENFESVNFSSYSTEHSHAYYNLVSSGNLVIDAREGQLFVHYLATPEQDDDAANKKYVDDQISTVMSNMTSGLKRIIVDELPTNNVDESAIYMLGVSTHIVLGTSPSQTVYEGTPFVGHNYRPNGRTYVYDEEDRVINCYSYIDTETDEEIKVAISDLWYDNNIIIEYVTVDSYADGAVSMTFYGYNKINNSYIEYMYINSRWEVIGNTSTEGGGSTNTIITNLQNTVSKQQTTIDELVQRLSELESIAATVYSLPN